MSGYKGTVLLSPVGGQVFFGIIEYFKNKDFKVIGIDKNPEALGKFFIDKFFVVHSTEEESYVNKVLHIIKVYNVDIFISWLDSEIISWNKKFFKSEIPKNITKKFAFNFREDIMVFYDKFNFYSTIGQYKFRSPKTFLFSNDENIKKLTLPVIIKPRISSGSRNVYIADNSQSLEYYKGFIQKKFNNIDNFIIQEYIDGIEYTIDFFSQKGVVKNLVIRKRVEHRGVSLKGEIVYNMKIEKLIKGFSSIFNIDGLNNIQVIESRGNLFIIECNPRPSGTIMLSVKAGVDLLNNLLERHYNKKITRYGKPKKLKMIRYLTELYYE